MLSTSCGFPHYSSERSQVWKTYGSRSGEGLSFRMLVILASGLTLWIAYGLLSGSIPIIVSNVAGLALVMALIVMKLIFDPAPTQE